MIEIKKGAITEISDDAFGIKLSWTKKLPDWTNQITVSTESFDDFEVSTNQSGANGL